MSENKIMKDKEIIIDGVDVSGCEYFSRYGNGCQLMQPLGFCKPQDNCLYKQLKRMEQKNADLNDEVEALKVAKNFASINLTNYIADNDKLKAENEKLYEEKICLHKIIDRLLDNAGYSKDIASAEDFEDVYENMQYNRQKLSEYKQTLQEIKEFAEIEIDCKQYEIDHDCFNDTRCKALKELIETLQEILELITKAESEG